MSTLSQFSGSVCRRPTFTELQCIVGFSTVGSTLSTDSTNQTAAFIDLTKIVLNGSRLICKAGGVGWIVSPFCTQVSRTWYCRNDALLVAQQLTQTCCTQWFVPTCGQLQNPGYTCRTYWDSYSSANYWSSTENGAACAYGVCFNYGSASGSSKSSGLCVRAFRCVTY